MTEKTVNVKVHLKYNNLSTGLKALIITAWIANTLVILSFLTGFILGLTTPI